MCPGGSTGSGIRKEHRADYPKQRPSKASTTASKCEYILYIHRVKMGLVYINETFPWITETYFNTISYL